MDRPPFFVSLDLSLHCGVAWWRSDWDAPRHAVWELPGGREEPGRSFAKLRANLVDLYRLEHRDGEPWRMVMERAITGASLHGGTNADTLYLLAGLAATAEAFAYAVNARIRAANVGSWRKSFIGKGSGLKTAEFKRLCIARCREFGWTPKNDNDADALGLLDHAVGLAGIVPPWREEKPLTTVLAA